MRPRHGWRLGVMITVGALVLAAAGTAGAAGRGLVRIAEPKPANLGMFDLTWYGSAFGQPTVFLSDQTAIDAFNARTDTYVGSFGQNQFVPFGSSPKACGVIGGIGPNGVLSLKIGGSTQVWAGNGTSSVNVYSLRSEGSGSLAAVVRTGGRCRADEMSYDPRLHVIMIANPSEKSDFVSFISVHADPKQDKVVGRLFFPHATAGLEQSVFDPNNGKFYLNVVQTTATNPDVGAVAVIDPRTEKVVRSFPVVGCQPGGMALDRYSNRMLLGCGAPTALMIMNARTGAIEHEVTALAGSDEVAFDAVTRTFIAPGFTPAGRPGLIEVSASTGRTVALVGLPADGFTHSIAAGGGKAFVPVDHHAMWIYSLA